MIRSWKRNLLIGFRVGFISELTSIAENPASDKMPAVAGGPSDEELARRIALHLLPGIGPVLARQLVSYCGGIDGIFQKRKSQLERIPGIGPERAEAILKANVLRRAEEEVRYIRKHAIRTYCYLDADYPFRLKQCDTAPILLFGRGKLQLNAPRMLAVVGTRKVTDYGRDLIAQFCEGMREAGVTIVSGLAYGVDIVAHQVDDRVERFAVSIAAVNAIGHVKVDGLRAYDRRGAFVLRAAHAHGLLCRSKSPLKVKGLRERREVPLGREPAHHGPDLDASPRPRLVKYQATCRKYRVVQMRGNVDESHMSPDFCTIKRGLDESNNWLRISVTRA